MFISLCIMLPTMSPCRRYFDETNFFFIQDNKLVRKYNETWDKVNKVIKNDVTVSLYSQ